MCSVNLSQIIKFDQLKNNEVIVKKVYLLIVIVSHVNNLYTIFGY